MFPGHIHFFRRDATLARRRVERELAVAANPIKNADEEDDKKKKEKPKKPTKKGTDADSIVGIE